MAMVCGGIGELDRDRVAAIAGAFDRPLVIRHDEPGGLVYADRALRDWSHGSVRGLSWGRTLPSASVRRGWRDAARDGDCGLVLGEGAPTLHSSTPGVFPLYWRALDGAIYFASRADPLARGTGAPLTTDWEAWAGLVTCGCVLGPRTPFREIRRLLPQSLLSVRDGEVGLEREEWPWLAIEPVRSIAAGAGSVLDALRTVVARMPDEPAHFGLSGGLDSRILACLAVERGIELRAVAVNGDSGNDSEQRAAARVARELGIELERIPSQPQDYWADTELRGVGTDFLRTLNPWLGPAHRKINELPGIALDGLAGDVTADRSRYMASEMLSRETPRILPPLWRALRAERGVPLSGRLGDELAASARAQVRECTRGLDGHPNRAVFGAYLTRMIGGVARVSLGSLGAGSEVEAPYATDEVAQQTLAVDPGAKFEASLRRAILERLNPRVARIPTNHEPAIGAQRVAQRRTDPDVLEGFRDVLGAGPLGAYLPADAWNLVTGRSATTRRSRRLWRAIDGAVTYHLWLRRYGGLVSGTEPPSELGARPDGSAPVTGAAT